MHSLLIRKISPGLKARLHARAALHQRSIEAEARSILTDALAERADSEPHWADAMLAAFGPEHGVELDLPERDAARELPNFGSVAGTRGA